MKEILGILTNMRRVQASHLVDLHRGITLKHRVFKKTLGISPNLTSADGYAKTGGFSQCKNRAAPFCWVNWLWPRGPRPNSSRPSALPSCLRDNQFCINFVSHVVRQNNLNQSLAYTASPIHNSVPVCFPPLSVHVQYHRYARLLSAPLSQIMAEVMGAEAAFVRCQIVSGTHAISTALFACLRPGDRLLAVAGRCRLCRCPFLHKITIAREVCEIYGLRQLCCLKLLICDPHAAVHLELRLVLPVLQAQPSFLVKDGVGLQTLRYSRGGYWAERHSGAWQPGRIWGQVHGVGAAIRRLRHRLGCSASRSHFWCVPSGSCTCSPMLDDMGSNAPIVS